MQSILQNTITFAFNKNGIEISYGQDQVYELYKKGGDLADLDEFLAYICPALNFDKININKALFLEKRLYRMLRKCRQQRSARKALKAFVDDLAARAGTPARLCKTQPLERLLANTRMRWSFCNWDMPISLLG